MRRIALATTTMLMLLPAAGALAEQAGLDDLAYSPSHDEKAVSGVLDAPLYLGSTPPEDGDNPVGKITELLATPDGRIGAVLVRTGGVFGINDREVAVAWTALLFGPDQDGRTMAFLPVSPEIFEAAPDYGDALTREGLGDGAAIRADG